MGCRRPFAHRGGAVPAALVALLLAGGCGQPAEPPAASPPPGPLLTNPVALQLYSLREGFEADGVPATLAKVKPMGFTYVELAGTYGLSREAFKEELGKAGLWPVSMHVDIDALVEDPAPFIDDARFYGVQHVGAAWFRHEGTFDVADAEKAIEAFNTAGHALAAAGLMFFYHAHGYEFAPAPDGGALFDLIASGTDPAAVHFQLDTFWAYHGSADPAALLQQYPTRFVSTHLKDMKAGTPRDFTGGAPEDTSVALGTGVIDIEGVLESARETSVAWHIIEEESLDPETNIPAGLAYVQQLAAAP